MAHGKETFSHKTNVEIECEFTDRLDLFLHEEVATGTHEKKKFRLINTGSILRLEYEDKNLIVKTRDLVNALMNTLLEGMEKSCLEEEDEIH